MNPVVTLCPHCSAKLRLADRALVGRQVECPDCEQPIVMVIEPRLGLVATKPLSDSETIDVQPRLRSPGRPALWGRIGASPVAISWIVAGLSAMALLLAVMSRERAAGRSRAEPAKGETGGSVAAVPSRRAETLRTDAKPQAATADEDGPAEAVRTSVSQLDTSLGAYRERHVRFPTGTVANAQLTPEMRFSWLALLLAQTQPAGAADPLWDRAWTDPLNDPFVRRRQAQLLNPSVSPIVGAGGYPATHYVGVAGVGADAAKLPSGHPRAGAFGYDRLTRLDDFKDGAANTMLAVGVQDQIGAWAAGGRATVRAFAAEPYFNGPDGFGTAQPKGMTALMADGSVRFVSSDTSPDVIRRIAALSDESLGNQIAEMGVRAADVHSRELSGEPLPRTGDAPNVTTPATAVTKHPAAQAPLPEGKSPAPLGAETRDRRASGPLESPGYQSAHRNVDVALAMKVVKFEQTRPVPFSVLLSEVRRMAGVPIEFEPPELEEQVAKIPVRLVLKRTTVGDILRALAGQAGLVAQIRREAVFLHAVSLEKAP